MQMFFVFLCNQPEGLLFSQKKAASPGEGRFRRHWINFMYSRLQVHPAAL